MLDPAPEATFCTRELSGLAIPMWPIPHRVASPASFYPRPAGIRNNRPEPEHPMLALTTREAVQLFAFALFVGACIYVSCARRKSC